MRVLLIEHDDRVAEALMSVLGANGHSVAWHRYSAGTEHPPADTDLVLLDLALPDADGLNHLRTLRANTDAPVLVLSARGDEPSVVQALQHGADDCLIKPLRMRELLARMHVAVRYPSTQPRSERSLLVGDIDINPFTRTVTVYTNGSGEATNDGTGNGSEGGDNTNGASQRSVRLTSKEFDILYVLARSAGTAVNRRDILQHVWGTDHSSNSGALSVHMSALRTKLNHPDLLRTIHGYGYRLG